MGLDHLLFRKYKLHHILFWSVYHFTWYLIFAGNLGVVTEAIFFSSHVLKFLFYVIFQAIAVYFNLYYLMPKFLDKGAYVTYITLTLITILVTAFLITPGYLLSSYFSGIPLTELYGENNYSVFQLVRYNSLGSTAAAMTLAMSIKLAKNYVASQKTRRLLEQEKLQTELKFLKSQFNPHFLFNTINSVFVLIKENPNLAQGTLAKFSELLRYQLYECNEARINLQQEIKYIKNFIDLERLRQNENVEIRVDIDQANSAHFTIAPFILMPFIENAFKHVGIKDKSQCFIHIQLRIENETLNLLVSNSKSESSQTNELIDYGGIGLTNVSRRLELLYPGKHRINTEESETKYESHLSVVLEKVKALEPALV